MAIKTELAYIGLRVLTPFINTLDFTGIINTHLKMQHNNRNKYEKTNTNITFLAATNK